MFTLCLTASTILSSVGALRIQPAATSQPRGQSAVIWSKAIESAHVIPQKDFQACDFKIHKPSSAEYDLLRPEREWFSQVGQDRRLAAQLTSPKGFFIESGAADGETNSNSLHFERKGWTGLLIEPGPNTFPMLLAKKRKAYTYNGALSTTGKPGKMYLRLEDCGVTSDKQSTDGECSMLVDGPGENVTEIEVAPAADLLKCLGRTTVDFWSLDVEGVESQILESFPFNDIEVGMLLVEMNKSEKNNRNIVNALSSHGFQECGRTSLDRIYVNPSYFSKRGLKTPNDC